MTLASDIEAGNTRRKVILAMALKKTLNYAPTQL